MRIILAGFGTVGQALTKVLHQDEQRIVQAYGFRPQLTTIVDSRGSCSDEAGLNIPLVLKTKEKYGTVAKYPRSGRRNNDSHRIISESDAEVVVETTPTNYKDGEPGLSNIKTALSNRKHVVTTNKGPLALAMPALLELARHRNLQLRFSGTVGGGTPFLDFAAKCMPGEKIAEIKGILNGTTNYILTRMEHSSLTFQKALAEAQKKGYAETDPTNDVEGFDTGAKIVIIANWIMNKGFDLRDVDRTGISKITPQMLRKAQAKGARVKLIGRIGESSASVRPEEISADDPTCVPDTLNALTFSTEHAGDITLIGPGAGGERTASAIVRDLVSIRKEYAL
ncbi:MAG TPA: homoserine dehydrogenase [Candidatus Sulfotelmatobacter sp.]|nr:homoserine dehydrogenase [Candidatus Sulfotelmatobacter sp.]